MPSAANKVKAVVYLIHWILIDNIIWYICWKWCFTYPPPHLIDSTRIHWCLKVGNRTLSSIYASSSSSSSASHCFHHKKQVSYQLLFTHSPQVFQDSGMFRLQAWGCQWPTASHIACMVRPGLHKEDSIDFVYILIPKISERLQKWVWKFVLD